MTRSPDQRLDAVEDELETAKRLLVSAASYAESANQGLDRLTERQDRTQVQLDRLTEKQDRTQTQLDQLTVTVEDISQKVDELSEAQSQTQTQLNQLSSQVDEFVFQAQRLFAQGGERLNNAEGIIQLLNRDRVGHETRIDRLEEIVQRLDRNYEAQQSQFQEFQRTTNAALERIDRVLDYLLRQQGG